MNISDGDVVASSTFGRAIFSVDVSGLWPFTLYSVEVYAVTVKIGEPSDIVTVLTSAAGT